MNKTVPGIHVFMGSSGLSYMLPETERNGAIEPYVYGLSRELSRYGVIDVFSLGKSSEQQKNLSINTFEYNTVILDTLTHVMGSEKAKGALFNVSLLKSIRRINQKRPIDIIHMHIVYSLVAAAISKAVLDVPVVCSMHNLVGSDMLSTVLLKSCDRILANSEFTKNFLIKEKGLESKRVSVLPIAINPDFHKPCEDVEAIKRELGLTGHRIILFVGRKCHYKGPQVLISSLPAILKANPDVLAVFIGPDESFGSSSSSFSMLLFEQARILGVERQVIMKSFVPLDVLRKYYCVSDIFVCPSIWQEPFGTVILEALAYQKPVVASNVGGIPEIISNNVNGLLIPPNNPSALADDVIYLLGNKENSLKLGAKGRETVQKKFSFEVVAKQAIQIYEELL
jgi:glycosyltransferase involved in cell wall biosynthesis